MGTLRTPIFLDATVVSNFASTDGLPVLAAILDAPMVAAEVRDEIYAGITAGHGFLESAATAFDDSLPVRDVNSDIEAGSFRSKLDAGEAASLAGALQSDGSLATDDLDARRIAQAQGVPVTGSVGLLVRAVELGELDIKAANEWLDIWRDDRGYFAPVDRIDTLLDKNR